jgi:hypothetical protein
MAAASEPLHRSATSVEDRIIKPLRSQRENLQDQPQNVLTTRSHNTKRARLETPLEDARDVAFGKRRTKGKGLRQLMEMKWPKS